MHGERRISTHQGWVGEKRDFSNSLLGACPSNPALLTGQVNGHVVSRAQEPLIQHRARRSDYAGAAFGSGPGARGASGPLRPGHSPGLAGPVSHRGDRYGEPRFPPYDPTIAARAATVQGWLLKAETLDAREETECHGGNGPGL